MSGILDILKDRTVRGTRRARNKPSAAPQQTPDPLAELNTRIAKLEAFVKDPQQLSRSQRSLQSQGVYRARAQELLELKHERAALTDGPQGVLAELDQSIHKLNERLTLLGPRPALVNLLGRHTALRAKIAAMPAAQTAKPGWLPTAKAAAASATTAYAADDFDAFLEGLILADIAADWMVPILWTPEDALWAPPLPLGVVDPGAEDLVLWDALARRSSDQKAQDAHRPASSAA